MNPQYLQWPRQGSAEFQALTEDYGRIMPGGHLMATSGRNNSNVSNISMSSNSTHSSWNSPLTPLSPDASSPDEYGTYSAYHTPLANEFAPPRDYLNASPGMYQPKNNKATPSSLGWTLASHWVQLYKFVVKQNGKERYFELLPNAQITRETPPRVDLDQDRYPVKGVHRCMYPGGCKGKTTSFNRPADLDRHYQNFHADDDMKKKFFCDYPKCARADDAFTRKDHYRDHLRDFHKEDLGCAKGANSKTKKPKEVWEAEQAQWLLERKIFPHYWRCSKCLDRITVSKSGWDCLRCNSACETERIEARRTVTPKAEVVDAMNMDTEYNPTSVSYLSCTPCAGNGYVDGGLGEWVACPSCQPSEQAFYNDVSYNDNNDTWQ